MSSVVAAGVPFEEVPPFLRGSSGFSKVPLVGVDMLLLLVSRFPAPAGWLTIFLTMTAPKEGVNTLPGTQQQTLIKFLFTWFLMFTAHVTVGVVLFSRAWDSNSPGSFHAI